MISQSSNEVGLEYDVRGALCMNLNLLEANQITQIEISLKLVTLLLNNNKYAVLCCVYCTWLRSRF